MGGGIEQCLPITREQLITLDNIREEEQGFKRYFQKKNRPIKIPKRYVRD